MLSWLTDFIRSAAFLESARQEPRYFTRERELTFTHLIAFLLSGVRGAVQCELDAFFAHLTRRSRLCRVITASAFSKARSRLRADVFDQLNTALLRRVDDILPDQPRWQGLRVLAADASKVRLTLLDREGRLVAAIGSPGGNSILAYNLKALVGILDWKMSVQDAFNLPNLIARGDSYASEPNRFAPGVVDALARKGVEFKGSGGEGSGLHGVKVTPQGLQGGADDRREGVAKGL